MEDEDETHLFQYSNHGLLTLLHMETNNFKNTKLM